MQRSHHVTFITTLVAFKKCAGAAALGALLVAHATAAELGEVTVHSFAGQPLVADIGLTALAPDELTSLQVRLASPDVYRGANVKVHPALASLRMAVMHSEGGQRQYVHITTRQAIDADYLHLFLELNIGDRHKVRAVTIWLAANPAPPAPPMIPAAPVAKVAPEAPAARTPVAAAAPRAASDGYRQPRIQRRQPAPKPGPKPAASHRSTSRSDAQAQAERERADQQIKDSAALGIENDALRSKIDVLEEKVAVLQQGYAARPVTAVPTAAVPRAVPTAAPVAGKTSVMSWIVGVAALLLLIVSGVLGFLYREKISASRHWVSLSKRFKRKGNVTPTDAE